MIKNSLFKPKRHSVVDGIGFQVYKLIFFPYGEKTSARGFEGKFIWANEPKKEET